MESYNRLLMYIFIFQAQLSNTLEPSQFAFTRQSDMEPSEDGGGVPSNNPGIPQSGVSLRTTKPTWSKKPSSIPVSFFLNKKKTVE